MADISKCTGIIDLRAETPVCPLRDSCYRYRVASSGIWQSYINPEFDVAECQQFVNYQEIIFRE